MNQGKGSVVPFSEPFNVRSHGVYTVTLPPPANWRSTRAWRGGAQATGRGLGDPHRGWAEAGETLALESGGDTEQRLFLPPGGD